ncbi:hypothetical protein [Ectobacillus antri]|uniref:hypothetical protein n=1 Tax=Ectobacillus antri TaxID=2486280 RepID=UPI0013DE0DF8|nr:hypothetical protein [Ectobacillus antri]
MDKFAVVVSKSPTGDVFVVDSEYVQAYLAHAYKLCGYAQTKEEAYELAELFC